MNLLCYLLLIFSLQACTTQQHQKHKGEISYLDQVPVIRIEKTFSVTEFGKNNFFGYVSNVLAGSNETIFVSDPSTRKIHVFNEDGTYKKSLGGYGAGPGEFNYISSMSLISPDTLQIADITLARISLYSVSNQEWTTFKLPKSPYKDTNKTTEIFSFKGFQRFNEGYIAIFQSSISTFVDNKDNYIKICFAKYGFNFQPIYKQKPLCFNQFKLVVYENFESSLHTVSTHGVPESYKTLFAITTSGKIVSTWTEKPEISIQHIGQSEPTTFKYPAVHFSITEELKSSLALKAIPNEQESNIRREQIINAIPPYKGYAEQILVDDKNRIWILTQSDDNKLVWLIYDLDGNLQARAFHPGGIFNQIKGNRIYVSNNSKEEVPSFLVYRIKQT